MRKVAFCVLVLFAIGLALGSYHAIAQQEQSEPRSQAEIVATGTVIQTKDGPVIRCAAGDFHLNECDINKEDFGKTFTVKGFLRPGPTPDKWQIDVKEFTPGPHP